ncbi:MAG: flavin monoamine oxidase family protein [Oligoflexia bacterium]
MAKIYLSFFQAWALLCLAHTANAGMPKRTDVVIIGAGLAGMATALELKKSKISYHILELTPRVGGRVRTVRYERPGEPTLFADSGMEEYWESNPAVKLIRDLKLPFRADVAVSSMVIEKSFVPLAATTEDYLRRTFSQTERQALDQFKTQITPQVELLKKAAEKGEPIPSQMMKLKDVSFGNWVRDQKLPKKVTEWIRISIECEVGTPWDRFSALDGMSEFHIFLGGPQGQGEMSYRVIGGNEKLTDAMARSIGLSQISLNQRVTRLVTRGNEVEVHSLDQATHQSSVIRASQVVSTIPLFRLFEVQFEPKLSDKKRQAIATQSWGSYFKAHVFVPQSASRYWKQDSQSTLPILSDSQLGVIYDGNPDANQNSPTKILSLLISGDHAEAFNLMPLDEVRSMIRSGFDQLWPGFSREIQGIEFYRFHPRAIANWPVGRSRFDELSQEIRKPENRIHFAGDFTENTHSSGAFISASRVAGQILKELGKLK